MGRSRYITWMVIAFMSIFLLYWGVFWANETAKLEIFIRNNIETYWNEWWFKVMSYFHFLRAKHPENEYMQDVLWDMIDLFEWNTNQQLSNTQIGTTSLWEYPWSTKKLVSEWNFDEDLIEKTRIDRVNNDIRIPRWLTPIQSEYKLRETARDWSLSLREKWVADHKRFSYSWYYDYKAITKRFADRGVVFKNVNRATSTENIGRARHTCAWDDCTQKVIDDIKRIYDYFVSEESYNGVHWRTMVHPEFKIVWISFAIDYENDKVFAVMHYGTALEE